MRFSTALKPTYEELQQKVKMLEGEVSDLKKVEDARLEIEKQLIDIQRLPAPGYGSGISRREKLNGLMRFLEYSGWILKVSSQT